MGTRSVYESFAEPEAEYRGKPFWAWNGKLEEEKLKKQIAVFKEMGFGGFFMHSRTGLETEYLSEEWFRLIDACILEGQKCGLESWIYDEDRWPSGTAGGLVTEKQEFRASFISMRRMEGRQWALVQEPFAAAFACRFCGEKLFKKRKINYGDCVSKEETVLLFSIAQAQCSDVYNGNTYLDTMNPNAVACFLDLTHRKYAEEVSGFKEIRGVFTDEPHRGPMFTSFNGGKEEQAPYTPGLFEKFYDKYGYSLRDSLPELFFLKAGEELSKVAYDYIELCQELFLESYALQMADWCKAHGLLFTGHVLHEDSLMAQTMMQGSLMRFYSYMDYPGVDVLLKDNRCFWIVKQAASVSRQMGKKKVLSELYGATGWQTTLEDYKNMGDWQALFGVNLRCPHLSLYTMAGEGKRDYPASIFSQLTEYKAYRPLEDYFSRLHVFMEAGEPDCHILVIYPIESVWARSHYGAYDYLEARDNYINKIENDFETLFWALVRSQVDFDYGDEGLMEANASVHNGVLHMGKCRYTKVVVSGMRTMRGSTLRLLDSFKAGGGKILFIGDAPEYVDVKRNAALKKMAESSETIPLTEEAVAAAFAGDCLVEVKGAGKRDIFVQSKRDPDGIRYMLWNSDLTAEKKHLEFVLPEAAAVEAWNPETGTVALVRGAAENKKLICDFAPGEMKLYRVFWDSAALEEPLSYELSEPNICVLDRVTVKTQEFECCREEVLRANEKLREAIGLAQQTGGMLQPWYGKKHGLNRDEKKYSVKLSYEFDIQDMPDQITLALEQGECPATVWVNGKAIVNQGLGEWVDSCFSKIAIPGEVLKKGRNRIQIQDTVELYHGIEAVFLLGEFSVWINRENIPVIGQLPKKIHFGDLCRQGFPFYSGKIRYVIPEMKGKTCRVRLRAPKAWGMKLIGDTEVNVSWAPYEGIVRDLSSIELILTRKNTFGPLHQSGAEPPLCEPASFHSTGTDWSERCVLQPQGLMEMPEIEEVI